MTASKTGHRNLRAALAAAFICALATPVALSPLPALAWGSGGGGGGGGGGSHKTTDPYDQEAFKPKKMTPADRDALTRLRKYADDAFKRAGNNPSGNPTPQEVRHIEQGLDQLDKKGYDTDPEYEQQVRSIKADANGGNFGSPALQPTEMPFLPSTSTGKH